jgi:hypothetical protein
LIQYVLITLECGPTWINQELARYHCASLYSSKDCSPFVYLPNPFQDHCFTKLVSFSDSDTFVATFSLANFVFSGTGILVAFFFKISLVFSNYLIVARLLGTFVELPPPCWCLK